MLLERCHFFDEMTDKSHVTRRPPPEGIVLCFCSDIWGAKKIGKITDENNFLIEVSVDTRLHRCEYYIFSNNIILCSPAAR